MAKLDINENQILNEGVETPLSLPSGIFGSLSYLIKNGWCIVKIYNVGGNGNNTVVLTDKLPKTMFWCHLQYSTAKAVWLNANSSGYSTLTLNGTDNVNIYGNLVFPIDSNSVIK